ncbi:hypothetical protein [Exiguobacterium sp. s78]|uniref:hypothetical protein n=1 Tax=Exiguobacterium sp. s78 TaxID=2751197 RepID=UPI001BEBA176|nr:hypothetical protein [Exiguobacterium sp. s78]
MKKFKDWWIKIISASVLWFVIPTFILVLTPTLWYTRPLLNLNSEDITIYKFAITILGVAVGIGTVINSTRSAKAAAESIRVTKEKELREQSPHLLALSESLEIPLGAPMYKKYFDESPPDVSLLSRENYRSHKEIIEIVEENKDNRHLNIEYIEYYKQYLDYEKFIRNLNNNKFDFNEISNFISVLNTGKGTATNLEYEFIFENINVFSRYKFDSSYSASLSSNVPIYSILVEDISTKNALIRVSDLKIPEEYHAISYFQEDNVSEYLIKKEEKVYLNVLPSNKEHQFPIPMMFSIMVKHYVICKYYQDTIKEIKNYNYLHHLLDTYINEKIEIPKGKIVIRYMDGEIIRLNNGKKRKVELTFDLLLKETSFNISNGIISNVFLETNFVSERYV